MKTEQYYVRVADKDNRKFNDFVDQNPQIGLMLLTRDYADGKKSILYAVRMDSETELAMKLTCNIMSCLAYRNLSNRVDKRK